MLFKPPKMAQRTSVLFATTRAEFDLPGLPFANGFAGNRLTYGTCDVDLSGVKPGDPFGKVPEKTTKGDLGITDKDDVLVFVHGFNNTFADAINAGARLKADLPWEGPLVVFSWPSWGQVLLYTEDEKIQAQQYPPFLQLLNDIKAANKIHILAHSMGNRIAVNALAMLPASMKEVNLGQLIFAVRRHGRQCLHRPPAALRQDRYVHADVCLAVPDDPCTPI